MYSREEMEIMNLDDNYTLLYPFLVKSLIAVSYTHLTLPTKA